MAVTDQQKLDFLLKKIGYTKTKTGSVVGTGAISGTPKQPFAEAIPSPLIIANGALWNEADSIPATPPGSDTTQVKVYLAATSGLRMTADATSSGQRAYIAYSTYGNTSSTRLTNWIDTQFGASYIIKVYKGDPNSGGVNLSAAGSGANDGWFFDYSAGVLNFNDTNVPSGVTDTNIYIVGYRYIGQTGAPTSGISTFSFKDLTVERNLDVGVQGGISTFRNNIDLNADIDVDGHTNLDNVSVAGVSTFASAIDLNADLDVDGHTNLDNVSIAGITTIAANQELVFGANADSQLTGRIKQLVSGSSSSMQITSKYPRINALDFRIHNINNNDHYAYFWSTEVALFHQGNKKFSTTGGGIDVIGNTVADGLVIDGNSDLNGDLDVDGHTNLDNISVAGVSTFTGDATFSGNVSIGGTLTYEDVTNVDSVGLLTARSGIRVTGGVIEAQAGENKIPSLYANYSDLPSAGSYHGMFAHVHATGRGYFAHAGNWLELVNADTTGRVGTGTESYFIDRLVSTSTTATSLNVVGVSTFGGNLDINADIDVDGHTNLDNVSVAGVTTITSSTYPLNVHADTTYQGILINGNVCPTVNFARNNSTTPEWKAGLSGNNADHFSISVGSANNDRLILRSNSATINGSYLNVNNLMLDHKMYHSADTDNFISFATDSQYFYTNNSERFKIQNSGVIITGIATVSGNIDANGDLDVDGHTNLDNVSIAGVTTFAGNIDANGDLDVDGHTNLDNVNISGMTTMSGNLTISNTAPTLFLTDTNHNSDFRVRVDGGLFTITDETNSADRLNINSSGVVNIPGNTNFGNGIDVTANITATGNADIDGDLDVDGHTELDNVNIVGVTTAAGHILPATDSTYDLGSSSKYWRHVYADNITGGGGGVTLGDDIITRNLKATGISTFVGNVQFDSTIKAGGATGSNGQYLKTTGTGVEWATFPTLRTRNTFTASAGQTSFSFSYTVNFLDVFVNGIKLTDAEFTATNGSSVVLAVGCFVGDIVELVSYNTVSGGGGGGGGSLNNIVEDTTPQLGGNLDLFNKTITGTGNINMTGVVTATSFIGNGSGLTGVVASGTGVVVKNSGSTVGTAGTINFGDNLSVSPASAGIVTITGSIGISTINGVASIVNDLDVDGHTNLDNVSIAGVVTATTFVGAVTGNVTGNATGLSGTPNISVGTISGSTGTFSGAIDANGDLDVDGHTNLDNVSIAGVVTATTIKGALEATSASFSSNIDANGDLDVDGHTNLDNVSISGISTATGGSVFGNIQAGVSGLNATIQKTDNSGLYLQYNKPGNLSLCLGGGSVTAHNNFSVVGYSTMTNGAKLGRLLVGYDNLYLTVQPISGENTLHLNYNNGTEVRIGEGQTRSDLIVKGDIEPRTDSAFDLGTTSVRWRNVYADTFVGALTGNVSGNATTASTAEEATNMTVVANNTTNETVYPVFVDGATGTQGAETDTGLTYNPSTGLLTALKFSGDGSALTGVTASGSGVVVQHDGSNIGTAGTINFSTNLDVSAISAGIVTITASGGGSGITTAEVRTNTLTVAGVSTFTGNIDANGDLDVDGHTNLDNVSIAGISTYENPAHFEDTIYVVNLRRSSGNLTVSAPRTSFQNAEGTVGYSTFCPAGLNVSGIVTATSFVGNGSNLTGISANVGITTNLSGTFTASAGSPSTINTFAYHDNDKVVEYTVYIKNGSNFQSQKLLAMRDGTTIHSTQFAVMYSSSLLVQCDATISSGNILLRATPETGVSGSTTYKVKREVM